MAVEIFLIVLAFLWIIVAVVQDVRRREVANWLSFSLVLFALAFRGFYALFSSDLWFFLNGLIGFAIFFIIANLFYYARLFAGGDAKLFMALGAILPFSISFIENLWIFLLFIFSLLAIGSVYSLIFTFFLIPKRKKQFSQQIKIQFKKNKIFFKLCVPVSLIFLILFVSLIPLFQEGIFLIIPLAIFILPFLYVYAKAVEESCMIKSVKISELTIGDWLYQAVKINIGRGKKTRTIKPDWQGLSENEIKLLRKFGKNKKILIKQGIPFVPTFLIALAIVVWLWYSSWLVNFLSFF